MKKILPIGIVIALAVGGGSFFGGMAYGKSQAVKVLSAQRGGNGFYQQFGGGQFRGQDGGRNGGPGGAGMMGGRNGGGLVSGEILSVDDTSITVKLRDGGSKIVLLSDKTEISKFVAGAAADLKVGENVIVMGAPNTDGSVTAQTVQLRPVPAAVDGLRDSPRPPSP